MGLNMKTLFTVGFRPFFLAASIYSACALMGWVLIYVWDIRVPHAWDDGMAWHAHEMLYGFAAAVIGGFLLTAVPNWTKNRPVQAWPLMCLLALWLAGRLVMHAAALPWQLTAAVDMLFLPALGASLLPAVMRGRSVRNYVFFGIIGVLTLLNGIVHADMHGMNLWLDASQALRTAVFLVALMIVIFGGRVIPAFTRNALKMAGKDVEIRSVPRLEQMSAACVALVAALSLCGRGETEPAGVVAMVAGALLLVRMAGWHGVRTLGMPIVWILHAGYLWIALGMLAYGAAILFKPSLDLVALHMLTIGGIGTMTLAMMSRVSLGHTGRALRAADAVVAAYVILQLAVLMRMAGGIGFVDYTLSVAASGTMWSAAFGIFAVVYLPILLRPRADGCRDFA
jgi:uncharacterized protein involved in response to NO